jgi:hypothetical protein
VWWGERISQIGADYEMILLRRRFGRVLRVEIRRRKRVVQTIIMLLLWEIENTRRIE